MKQLLRFKTFLIMAVLAMIGTSAWGADETFTFSGLGYSDAADVTTVNGTNCAITFAKGTNSNAPKYYTRGTAIRAYGGNTFTVSSTTKTIAKIEITFGSSDGSNAITTDVDTYSNGTWEGNASSVTFTIGGTTGNRRLAAIAVTYAAGGETPMLEESDLLLTGTTALTFDLYNNNAAQVINYTTSSTGAVTVTENDYVSAVVADGTITVTPMKKTRGDVEITVNQAKDDTYKAGSATFTVNIKDSTPVGDVAEETIKISELSGYSTNGTEMGKIEGKAVTLTWSKGTNSNAPKAYGTGSEVRFYKGNTITFTASKAIAKIEFTYSSGYNGSNFTANTGSVNEGIWTGNATEVTLTNGASDNTQIRFTAIKITYADESDTRVATTTTFPQASYTIDLGDAFDAPTATVKAGEDVVAGATVTYSGNNDALAAVDATTGALTFVDGATGEIKVTATYEGDETNYKGSTGSYTLTVTAPAVVFTSLKDLQDNVTSTSQDFTLQMTDVYVTAVKNSNAWITDGTYGALIYTSGHGLTAGQKLNGTLSAKYVLYRGQTEITDFSTTGLTITEEAFTPVDVADLSILSAANQSLLVTLKNVTYNGSKLSDGTNTITPYTTFMSSLGLESGKTYNVTGIVVLYDTTLEIAPRTEADIVEVGAPVVASIAVDPNVVNATSSETDGTIAVTYNNITTVFSEVKFYEADGTTEATYDWLEAEINTANNIDYLIGANTGEARTAYMKVYALDDDANDVYSELITINQAAYVAPAATTINLTKTLVFNTDCGLTSGGYTVNDELTILSGTFEGDDSATRFDGFVIKDAYINSESIQMKASSGSITFPDIESEHGFDVTVAYKKNDAIVYINGEATTEASEGVAALKIATGTKYCQITSITLTPKTSATPVTVAAPTFSVAAGEVEAGTEVTITSAEGTVISYTTDDTDPAESSTATVTDANTATVIVNEAMTIRAIALDSEANESEEASATYTIKAEVVGTKYYKVTSTDELEEGVNYLLVYEGVLGEGAAAYGGLNSYTTNSYGKSIALKNIDSNVVTITDEAVVPVRLFSHSENGSKWSMRDANGWLAAINGNNNLHGNKTEEDAIWTFDFSAEAGKQIFHEFSASEVRYLQYNTSSPRFAGYTGNQSAVCLYKEKAYNVTVSTVGYATLYYGETNLVVPEGVEAYTYKVTDGKLDESYLYEANEVIPAGTGVVLKANAGEYKFVVTTEVGFEDPDNLLRGSDVAVTTEGPAAGDYLFYLLGVVDSKVGFYWGKEDGAAFTSGAHKAYLAVPAEQAAGVRGFTFDGTTVGISTIGVQMPEGEAYDLQGRRVQQFQKGGLYIVGGKKLLAK